MRHAFHFKDANKGWHYYDEVFCRALLCEKTRIHLLIRRGNISFWESQQATEEVVEKATYIVGSNSTQMSSAEYVRTLSTRDVYVLLVQGMTRRQAFNVASRLSGNDFITMLELDFAQQHNWAVYSTKLLPSYRIIGNDLRLQHTSVGQIEEDDRDQERLEYWRNTNLFARVVWENIGVRTTIFDWYFSSDHELIVGETENLLSDLLEGVANQVMLRVVDLDPKLVEALHAAMDRLHTARTSEQLAQAALSCRRFLERFANRLYPPTDEKRGGRSLDSEHWKNRLWAYAEDAINSDAAAKLHSRLMDIGQRIDAVTQAANSGVHRPEVQQTRATQLVVALVLLTYDLALLSPPPTELPEAAYLSKAAAIAFDLLSDQADQ